MWSTPTLPVLSFMDVVLVWVIGIFYICFLSLHFVYFGGIFRNGGTNGLAEICHARYVECCKCKWKDIQLFSGSFRGEIQLDGNINKDKQKVRCQEVGQRRDKDVKWSWLRWHSCSKTLPKKKLNSWMSKNVKIHKCELEWLSYVREREVWYL